MKSSFKILIGKEMPYTFWGRKGHVRYYSVCSDTYFYGIKGIIGLKHHKELKN